MWKILLGITILIFSLESSQAQTGGYSYWINQLNSKIDSSSLNSPNGIATLSDDSHIKSMYLRSTIHSSLFQSFSLPDDQSDVEIVGGARSYSLILPTTADDGFSQTIHIRTKSGKNYSHVSFIPSSGQQISDGYVSSYEPLNLDIIDDITLIYSASTNTWKIDGDSPPPSLVVDIIDDNYMIGYMTTPVSTTLDNLWTYTNSGPATYIDNNGIIRDATPNTPRSVYSIDNKHSFMGYYLEPSHYNVLPSTISNSVIQFPWGSENSVTPTVTTQVPALYQGSTYSAAVYNAPVSSATDPIVAKLGASPAGYGGSSYVFAVAVWIPVSFSGSDVWASISGTNWTGEYQQHADMSLRDQWQWIWCTGNQSSASNSAALAIRQSGASTSDYLLLTVPSFGQISGGTLSSYVPTISGTYVKNPGDVFTPTSNNNVDLLNGGTLVLDSYASFLPTDSGTSNTTVSYESVDLSSSISMGIVGSTTPYPLLSIMLSNNIIGMIQLGGPSQKYVYRTVVSINDNDIEYKDSDGGQSQIDYINQLPNLSRVGLSSTASGIFRSIYHYPERLSPNILESISKTSGPYSITVDQNSTGLTIPQDFVGISFETSAVQQATSLNNNTNLTNILTPLFKNSCNIRFGGDKSDDPSWLPTVSRITDAATWVSNISSSCNMIWGLNYIQDNTTNSISQVQAISSVLGDSRVIYQIGNEPDYYSPSITFSTYQAQWTSIHDAILNAEPNAQFGGPDIGQRTYDWMPLYISNLGSKSVMLSKHLYPFSYTTTLSDKSDIQGMWNDKWSDGYGRNFGLLASSANKPIRMTEMGTSNKADIGNTLGASLWNLSAMIDLANDGWSGVNFHESDAYSENIAYMPAIRNSDGTYTAQSSLYAMLLFSELDGGKIISSNSNLPENIDEISVLATDGSTKILIVNKDKTKRVIVDINSSVSFSSATEELYTGPSYDSTYVTLGGSIINSNGSFNPSLINLQKNTNGNIQVSIPASSASLINIK